MRYNAAKEAFRSLQAQGSSTVADMLYVLNYQACAISNYCEFPMSINSDFRDDIEYINLARKPKPYINLKSGAFIEQIFWLNFSSFAASLEAYPYLKLKFFVSYMLHIFLKASSSLASNPMRIPQIKIIQENRHFSSKTILPSSPESGSSAKITA